MRATFATRLAYIVTGNAEVDGKACRASRYSWRSEFAFRAGVNMMYTLPGNYKADQVHISALLERLGQ